jgi:hypothetical protein
MRWALDHLDPLFILLQAVPYLSGLPLSVTMTATPDVITALVSKLPSLPPAAAAPTSAAEDEGDGATPLSLKQLENQRQTSSASAPPAVAPPPRRAPAPQPGDDSQPDDLWEEITQPSQQAQAQAKPNSLHGSQWPGITQRPRKMSV